MIPQPLEISSIHAAYRDGSLTPPALFEALIARMNAYADKAVFISRIADPEILQQAEALDLAQLATNPLFGIPFVV